jgi:hypothetical protein
LRTRIEGKIDDDGAVISVGISVGEAEAAYLEETGNTVVAWMSVTALIDSGASRTSIHPLIARQLGLVEHDFTTVDVPGQGTDSGSPVHCDPRPSPWCP